MRSSVLRAAALPCALLATTCLTAPAMAQTGQHPSVHHNFDGNGVDLTDGSFNFSMVEGSIGTGAGTLAMVRSLGRAGWTYGIPGRLYRSLYSGNEQINLSFDNRSEPFRLSGGAWAPVKADGATISGSADSYTYRSADGTTVIYGAPGRGGLFAVPGGNGIQYCIDDSSTECELLPLSVTRPDGRRIDLYWTVAEICGEPDMFGGQPCDWFPRLSSIVNESAYMAKIRYATDSYGGGGPAPDWFRRIGARLVNTAVEACDPYAADCSLTMSWPTIAYAEPSSGVTEVTDPAGRTWRFSGGSGGFAIRRPGSASDDVTVSFDANNRVSQVTADGVTTSYAFADSGSTRTATVTDALSQQRTIVSDLAIGRPTSVTDELGRTTAFQYDADSRLTRVTAPEGNYVQYTLDARGNATQTRAVAKSGSGLADIVTSAAFPSSCANVVTCNRPTSTTDARGHVTDYSWDATHGGLLSVTLPAAPNGVRPQTRHSYTLTGGVHLPTATSACRTQSSCAGTADEVRTSIAYDGANLQPVSMSSGAGDGSLTATVAMGYDRFGNLITLDGPLAGTADTTRFRYDDARQPAGTIGPDPDGSGALRHRAVRTTYRPDGQPSSVETGTVLSQSDADWANFVSLETVSVTFNANSRPVRRALVAGGATQAVEDLSYDALGRPLCAAQRMNAAAWGTLTGACTLQAAGSFGPDRIARTVYDAAGQVTQQIAAYGTADQAAEVTASYTANGRAATVTDGESNRTTYEYDGHDRLSQTRFPVPTQGANQSSTTDYEQLSYDAAGNIVSRQLRDGNVVNYTYDALNRMTLKDHPAAGTNMAAETDTQYAYDNFGRLTWSHVPADSGNNILAQWLSYSYDALGRVTQENGRIGIFASEYDLAGRRTRLTHPDGFYVTHEYLVTGEMSAIRENGSTLLASFAYDNQGRRTTLTRGNGTTTSYSYDAASRLSQLVENVGGTAHDFTLGFSHNPASQIASNTRSNDAYAWTDHYNVSRGYTANGLNQYTASGAVNPTYDGRGNLVQAGGPNYLYNAENRLRSASGQAELFYDPVGRLVQMTSLGMRWYGYDGPNLLLENNGAVENPYDRRFVFGPGTDEALVWYEGSDTSDRRWLHADERGSIVAVTNDSGAAIGINAYDEYGIPASTNIGRFQYTGQAWLPEIGMYHYKARVYSPYLGRFLQTDPIGYGDGMNMYAYVGNDPVNGADPTGMLQCPISRIQGCSQEQVESTTLGAGVFVDYTRGGGSSGGGGSFVCVRACGSRSGGGNGLGDIIVNAPRVYEWVPSGGVGAPSFGGRVLALALLAAQAEAQPAVRRRQRRDDCTLSPEQTPMGDDFSRACRAHDPCYQTLGASRARCDLEFLNRMLEECQGSSSRFLCEQIALRYYLVIRKVGGFAWEYEQWRARNRLRGGGW